METGPDLRIVPLEPRWHAEAAQLLARAFVTNPLNIAAFGRGQLARNEAFFLSGLPVMYGARLVALDGTRVAGFIHWVKSPGCQVPAREKLKMLPGMVRGLGLRAALRTGRWMSVWEKHDPREAHLHLGPIGIDPEMQGKGLGRRLMTRYCETADAARLPGYLETDRAANVPFYAAFGFRPVAEVPVLGVTNYHMRR